MHLLITLYWSPNTHFTLSVATDLYYLLDDLRCMVEQVVCDACPGIALQRLILSANDMRAHRPMVCYHQIPYVVYCTLMNYFLWWNSFTKYIKIIFLHLNNRNKNSLRFPDTLLLIYLRCKKRTVHYFWKLSLVLHQLVVKVN